MALVKLIAGERMTRVPMDRIRTIHDAVNLDCPGSALGLHKSEKAAARWLPHKGAL
jgi:hypothetical protein